MRKQNKDPVAKPANGKTWFGLKLARVDRSEFKRIARENGTTMQSVLSAFVKSYVENPDKFQIKVNMELNIQP